MRMPVTRAARQARGRGFGVQDRAPPKRGHSRNPQVVQRRCILNRAATAWFVNP